MKIEIEDPENRSSPIGILVKSEDVKPCIQKMIKQEIKTPSPKKLQTNNGQNDESFAFVMRGIFGCEESLPLEHQYDRKPIESIPRIQPPKSQFKAEKRVLCRFFLKGKCRFGSRCNKIHPLNNRYPADNAYNEALTPRPPQACLRPRLPSSLPLPSVNRKYMPTAYHVR